MQHVIDTIVIGKEAFSKCTGITEIIIHDAVRILRGGTFSSCSKLERVELAKQMTELGSGEFAGCEKLEKVVIAQKYCKIYDSKETFANSITLVSHEGSKAETYAEKYENRFEAVHFCGAWEVVENEDGTGWIKKQCCKYCDYEEAEEMLKAGIEKASINKTELLLEAGSSELLSVSYTPQLDVDIFWSSSNEEAIIPIKQVY